MDPCPRRAKPPVGLAGTPPGAPRQREVELLRLVRVRGIFGVRTEHEDAAGDRVADEGAAVADPFAPAVIVEEALAEIGARIGLPPVEIAGQRRGRFDQRPRARRGVAATGLAAKKRPVASARRPAVRSRPSATRG